MTSHLFDDLDIIHQDIHQPQLVSKPNQHLQHRSMTADVMTAEPHTVKHCTLTSLTSHCHCNFQHGTRSEMDVISRHRLSTRAWKHPTCAEAANSCMQVVERTAAPTPQPIHWWHVNTCLQASWVDGDAVCLLSEGLGELAGAVHIVPQVHAPVHAAGCYQGLAHAHAQARHSCRTVMGHTARAVSNMPNANWPYGDWPCCSTALSVMLLPRGLCFIMTTWHVVGKVAACRCNESTVTSVEVHTCPCIQLSCRTVAAF